ncbi:hypothetical protein K443DRAFT_408707 [Laccaria amethystina LaAM-08-1]|uniref:Uncharacterized protein n=1 Tax=Laccaria amethystina LaAM-08-1 TaxID=1095629 RepID=A0A0C9X676_9AGAR|nr:hypothetical protein K443DRAFT_408707 [Laccaria amethystina LaAM-08-1]
MFFSESFFYPIFCFFLVFTYTSVCFFPVLIFYVFFPSFFSSTKHSYIFVVQSIGKYVFCASNFYSASTF